MDKIGEICRTRKQAHRKLLAMDSKVYRAFLDMEAAAYADGALAKKHKELIAVGISVVTDCESCMQWHIEQAVKAGAGQQEVLEAIEVGMEMGGGRATVSARFALEVLESILGESTPR
jgi:AhpD family alkylhydroperoxidase